MSRRIPNAGAVALHQHEVCASALPRTTERVSPCPSCSAETVVRRFEVEGMEEAVVVCTECGLGRSHPMPSPSRLRALYPDEYYGELGRKFQPLIEGLVRAVGARHISFRSRATVSTCSCTAVCPVYRLHTISEFAGGCGSGCSCPHLSRWRPRSSAPRCEVAPPFTSSPFVDLFQLATLR